jgi:hypothetical protein
MMLTRGQRRRRPLARIDIITRTTHSYKLSQ